MISRVLLYLYHTKLTALDFVLNAFRSLEKINVQDLRVLELVVFCFMDPTLGDPDFWDEANFTSWF